MKDRLIYFGVDGYYQDLDAQESIPLFGKFIEETPLDPDFAKATTKDLVKIQEEILEEVRNKPLNPKTRMYRYRKGNLNITSGGQGRSHIYLKHAIEGIGIGTISLSQFDDINDGRTSLRIGIHTDQPTQQQVERLLKPSLIESLSTVYLFEANGNYEKRSWFPDEIKDPRPKIQEGSNVVASQMTISDFEFAGMALQKLKDALTPPENPNSDKAPITPADSSN